MRQNRHVAERQKGFSVRLHPAEKQFIQDVARYLGIPVASLFRQLVIAKARELGLEVPDFAKSEPPPPPPRKRAAKKRG